MCADGKRGTSLLSGLQKNLELPRVTALDEEELGSWPFGRETRRAATPCSLSRSDRACAASCPLLLVGIKGQIDGSRAVAQLPKLVCVEMISHRAGDVAITGCHKTA